VAIDALEKIIEEYSFSPLAPDALLLLAKVHRDRVRGPDYDQWTTREAINYFRQFLTLFPLSERRAEAEAGLREAEELLAASYLSLGNFYYDGKQNPSAAIPYYREALTMAAGSETGNQAHRRLEDIGEGKPGKGSPIDFLFDKSSRH
jgi:outer membrane protein assembly factor BamD